MARGSNKLGSWAFIVGLILAVVLGFGFGAQYETTIVWALFVIGIAVGLLNVTAGETQSFLTAGTILALMAFLGHQSDVFGGVQYVEGVLAAIMRLFVPATIIVALKAVYELARD